MLKSNDNKVWCFQVMFLGYVCTIYLCDRFAIFVYLHEYCMLYLLEATLAVTWDTGVYTCMICVVRVHVSLSVCDVCVTCIWVLVKVLKELERGVVIGDLTYRSLRHRVISPCCCIASNLYFWNRPCFEPAWVHTLFSLCANKNHRVFYLDN